MKILQINKFWYPKGGADVYALFLTKLLEEAGHEVARFGMHHEDNEPSPWNKYFVSEARYNEDTPRIGAALSIIYSREAKKNLEELIAAFQPDVIHLHNFYHQLSSSILPVCRASGARVVMTAHDYKLISPDYSLFSGGRIKELTKVHRYYRMLWHRGSWNLAERIVLAVEAYYTWLGKRYKKNIEHVIAPARFMKKKIEEYSVGIPTSVLFNAIDTELLEQPVEKKDYVLFVGRLDETKGLRTLLKAAQLLPQQQFIIIGEGPEKPPQWSDNVQWLGYKSREEVREYMAHARALIVPSEWYEVNSLVIPEAHAVGTWVIASDTGTFDNVNHDTNGWFFSMHNAEHLAEQIERAQKEKPTFEPFLHMSPEEHLKQLLAIYSSEPSSES